LGKTAGSLTGRLRRRRGRGSKGGVARISMPAIAIAIRGLVRLASTPHSAVSTAIVVLLLIDHADRVRASREPHRLAPAAVPAARSSRRR
jgi:hypothetical protein